MQFILGLITLRTKAGYNFFKFLGEMMSTFLKNTAEGSGFVFGDLPHFGFTVLPVVIFFSSFISILFHLGVISILIEKPSALAKKVMGTTGPETLNAIANMFVGMTEAPLITRPYLHLMTGSELHAIMVNGFASVAGSVLAAYIKFGVSPHDLMIACVMSAPAGLAISKILHPETKRAPLASLKSLESVKILYRFMNGLLTWFGERAQIPTPLTFELIFSYLLWPVAFTMGVPQEDCFKVAELIGVKMMLNEFAAYKSLVTGHLLNASYNFLSTACFQSDRAVLIVTYCLCGFANIGSIGIMLGSMVTMLPHRRNELSGMVLSAMIGGTVACFLTGSFAGKLFAPF
ncbi:unnamed protein product [Dibothriocephalus latus]|uniref:Concentrative nucleoside transporter C-terminal domain-containing protein n=1 Tax=Dibothriocephalus latus TaxID=60516 RepID=A0A3P7NL64_DIBLA|nr:unnamed protein product [Dibothriocephalus latus]